MFHLLLVLASLFSIQNLVASNFKFLTRDSILELFSRNDSLIVKIDETGRVYLNPENISARKEGLFLNLENGELLRISSLFSNAEGCFFSPDSELATVYPVIRCRACDLPFSPTIFNQGRCPRCGTQN